MQTREKILAGVLSGLLLFSASAPSKAATVHYNDGSAVGGGDAWSAWTQEWPSVATDFTKVSLTPGKNETELNFAWYSKVEAGKAATPVVRFGTDKAHLTPFTGVSATVDQDLTGDGAYVYNHVTVTGLQENTSYWYTVEKNGVQTDPVTYQTGSFSNVRMLYVGDPQIGASKGQPQGAEKLVADQGVDNTAAQNDAFGWNRTLETAAAQSPGISFIISAGDQVNRTGKPKEEEYAGYLSPKLLQQLPVATTIGNHDSLNPDYKYHFNNPNTTEYGATQAGGDYYYSYGPGLFIVLNTNNYNVAEHEQAIAQAVASAPDATWRVVTIHQDIYGTGLDHSDTDGIILRTQLTPIFDRHDIDVVLQGHDHTYSRSKLLYGDGKTHSGYEFRLNAEGTDYDWGHAYNIADSTQIPLAPQEGDSEGGAKLDAFQQDNLCYTIESTSGNTAVNPEGVLYLSANSASGSKFYELIANQQDYIANRSQNWLPSYSVIDMTPTSFSIDTYQITDGGKAEKIDQTFTIQKTKDSGSAAVTRAGAAQALYEHAGSPAVSGAATFSDVPASATYAKAVAWAQQQGIVKGMSQGSFAPASPLTRQQLAVLLFQYTQATGGQTNTDDRLSGCSDASAVAAWALDGVNHALNAGLLQTQNGRFAPSSPVTSSELAELLSKLS